MRSIGDVETCQCLRWIANVPLSPINSKSAVFGDHCDRKNLFGTYAINWWCGNVSVSPMNCKRATVSDQFEECSFWRSLWEKEFIWNLCDQLVMWRRVSVSDELQTCHCLRSIRRVQFLEIIVRERIFWVFMIKWWCGDVSVSPMNCKRATVSDQFEECSFWRSLWEKDFIWNLCDQLVMWKRVSVSDELQTCHCLRSIRRVQFLEIIVRERIFWVCMNNWWCGNVSVSPMNCKRATVSDQFEECSFWRLLWQKEFLWNLCDQLVMWKRVSVSDELQTCHCLRSIRRVQFLEIIVSCLLYTSPSPRDA